MLTVQKATLDAIPGLRKQAPSSPEPPPPRQPPTHTPTASSSHLHDPEDNSAPTRRSSHFEAAARGLMQNVMRDVPEPAPPGVPSAQAERGELHAFREMRGQGMHGAASRVWNAVAGITSQPHSMRPPRGEGTRTASSATHAQAPQVPNAHVRQVEGRTLSTGSSHSDGGVSLQGVADARSRARRKAEQHREQVMERRRHAAAAAASASRAPRARASGRPSD